MVKRCTKTHPYARSSLQQLREFGEDRRGGFRNPAAASRCAGGELGEDGGRMMTFIMIQHYVTSITNDATGALAARQGTYGGDVSVFAMPLCR